MKRYALGIEYDGRGFHGWQAQREDPSVQLCLENALAVVADHSLRVICAGRTDTGVHARCQVVHFDSEAKRSERQWVLGLNSNLPATACVLWVRPVDAEFHARFCAFERHYQYTILNRWIRPALRAGQVAWCPRPLDAEKMHEAATALLGEHDFSAFRSAGCKARHAVREIRHISVRRAQDDVVLDIAANGFLYHMVRNIVGSLLDIGKGEKPVAWLAELLQARDRKLAGVTAPPDGLCFLAARYPDSFGLPRQFMAFPQHGRGG